MVMTWKISIVVALVTLIVIDGDVGNAALMTVKGLWLLSLAVVVGEGT